MMWNNVVVTLTGPSASGKSTLEQILADKGFARLISTTTRPMRQGEQDGVNYYYVSGEQFKQMDMDNEFAEKVEFDGNNYGVTIAEFERAFADDKPVVVVVEPDGARQISRVAESKGWRILRVFIDGDREELIARFLMREGGPVDETHARRIARRLFSLVSVETQWHLLPQWDITFDRFDARSEDGVIDVIMDWAVAASSPREVAVD